MKAFRNVRLDQAERESIIWTRLHCFLVKSMVLIDRVSWAVHECFFDLDLGLEEQ